MAIVGTLAIFSSLILILVYIVDNYSRKQPGDIILMLSIIEFIYTILIIINMSINKIIK